MIRILCTKTKRSMQTVWSRLGQWPITEGCLALPRSPRSQTFIDRTRVVAIKLSRILENMNGDCTLTEKRIFRKYFPIHQEQWIVVN